MAYEGPNVTLGYALYKEDLLKGDERKGIYYTSDIAYRDGEGFYYILGRKSRFLKLFGHRVGLEKCIIGENAFGYVFPQGDVSSIGKIEKLLKLAGGKPKECDLNDFSQGGKGKGKPEYVITFNDDIHTIIVIECKNTAKMHSSDKLNRPGAYAVDGVLYYAKFLKREYNVIAVAISGTNVDNMKVDTFYWTQGQDTYTKLEKAKDIILEPQNYVELIKGNKLKKAYSLDEIRNTAIDMHNSLREIKVTEAHKPIFIAGILQKYH